MLFSMMMNVYSKHEYFDEHLKKEIDQLNTIEKNLFQLKKVATNNLDINDKSLSLMLVFNLQVRL